MVKMMMMMMLMMMMMVMIQNKFDLLTPFQELKCYEIPLLAVMLRRHTTAVIRFTSAYELLVNNYIYNSKSDTF